MTDSLTPTKTWTGNRFIRVLTDLVWLPWLWLELVSFLAGTSWTPGASIVRLGVIGTTLVSDHLIRRLTDLRQRVALASGLALGAFLIWRLWPASLWTAGGLLVALFLFFLSVAAAVIKGRGWLAALVLCGYLGLMAGSFGTILVQVENLFSDEEFEVAVQAAVLIVLWFLLLAASRVSASRREKSDAHVLANPKERRFSNLLMAVMAALSVVGGIWAAGRYQSSFFPLTAAQYPGISEQSPFLCDTLPSQQPLTEPVDGAEVFSRLLDALLANPTHGTADLGMLALGTGDRAWADQFRVNLLNEARIQAFTGPSNSVKYGQFLASWRIYYYPRVVAAFPDLFSLTEQDEIKTWFYAINRQALTAEWVDWLYGLALGQVGEGPYVNQEIGSSLIALLTAEGLADPALAERNTAYLAKQERGWAWRFRYPDDAFVYQGDWITSASFLAQNGITGPDWRRANAFEWVLLQALPTGDAPRYNHPLSSSLTTITYFAALELKDPRFLWLTNRALDVLAETGGWIAARPGDDSPVDFQTAPPTAGSCLIYGDSGLPNQAGPLAPDKIVLRDGWAVDDAYVLQNLRFTGWHRYKATGSVSLVYQAGQLAAEVQTRSPITWLPAGRSMVRDKRTPREYMNGLLVGRTGMDALLHRLTGMGGLWSQDPPYYADILAFDPGAAADRSHIQLANWQGWQHDREVYLYHDGGPIVVVDQAQRFSPGSAESGLTWHLSQSASVVASDPGSVQEGIRLTLRETDSPAEFGMTIFPLTAEAGQIALNRTPVGEESQRLDLTLTFSDPARWTAVSFFLFDEWVGAEVSMDATAHPPVLRIRQTDREIAVPLPEF